MSCDLLLYTHGFHGGGAERVTVQLANHWSGAGVRVAMVVNVDGGPLRHELSPAIAVRVLNRPRGLLAAPALARAIRDLAPGAVVSAMTEQNIVTCFARRLARYAGPVLTVEHNFMSSAFAAMPGWRSGLLKRLMRVAYPMADAVSAVSEASARDLDGILGKPRGTVAVLYNPIADLARTPGLSAADVHPWLSGPDPVLLSVGRLVPQKNHANLLRAVAIARESRPVRVLVLGDGPLRGDLEALARSLGVADAVDFLGFRRDVADLLHFSDLLVLSSDWEGLPLALMEALKMGTPIVSTDCQSGPRELLDGGRLGQLVPVRDSAALAAGILRALAEPAPREALVARAADFSTEEVVRRYEEALFPAGAVPWRREARCVRADARTPPASDQPTISVPEKK